MEKNFNQFGSTVSARNVAEIQLSYTPKVKAADRPKITSSRDAYGIFRCSWDENLIDFVEQFKVMLLNRANKILGVLEVSTGGMSGTVADPKLIFAAALKAGASGMILSHNHPSSNLQPSDADILLTKKVKAGGELLEISVLDHLIVTSEGYFSFADEGLL